MPQLRKVLQGAGATFSHWYVNTPVCCPSRSETLSGRYHHNLRNDGFRRDPDGGWCSGDEAVGEPHPCGCMDINNTALPDALAFHSQTYADYLQRASYVTVRMRPAPPPSCPALVPTDGAETSSWRPDRGTSASSSTRRPWKSSATAAPTHAAARTASTRTGAASSTTQAVHGSRAGMR